MERSIKELAADVEGACFGEASTGDGSRWTLVLSKECGPVRRVSGNGGRRLSAPYKATPPTEQGYSAHDRDI